MFREICESLARTLRIVECKECKVVSQVSTLKRALSRADRIARIFEKHFAMLNYTLLSIRMKFNVRNTKFLLYL